MRLGLVQMCSGDRHDGNIAVAAAAVRDAAAAGAEFVAFPEVAGMMNRRIEADRALIRRDREDPYVAASRDLAARHRVWIHTGSTPVLGGDGGRFLNRSHLIDPAGAVIAHYDKVHLFDITPEGGAPIRESARFAPGADAVMPATPWGPVGMSICYDLRFPQFYRDYARDGATLLVIPSAFTPATGRAHWEVLLRARAIENGAFVIAAAQSGRHVDGRETYGHGMVVDPFGRVALDMGTELGVAVIDLDIPAVARARSAIPSLAHGSVYQRR